MPAAEWSEWDGAAEYARPPGWPFAADEQPDTCPGYLIQLPEVLEAAIARFWKDGAQLSARFGGLEIPKPMLQLIEVISSEDAELHSYRLQKLKAGH